MNVVDEQIKKAAKAMADHADHTALGHQRLWYVRSTGEIIGPNWGKLDGKQNKHRNEFGNLFTDERSALKAQKYIRLVLRFMRWLP